MFKPVSRRSNSEPNCHLPNCHSSSNHPSSYFSSCHQKHPMKRNPLRHETDICQSLMPYALCHSCAVRHATNQPMSISKHPVPHAIPSKSADGSRNICLVCVCPVSHVPCLVLDREIVGRPCRACVATCVMRACKVLRYASKV